MFSCVVIITLNTLSPCVVDVWPLWIFSMCGYVVCVGVYCLNIRA